MLRRSALFIILFSGFLLAACSSSSQNGIVVEDIWGRPSPKSASNAAFYMVIHNGDEEQEVLVEAAIDICGATELHMSSIDEDGVMSMQHVRQIEIPAGGTTTLEPGGLHIMCLDRQAELNPGDRVPVSLLFAQSGELVVEAEIGNQ